MLLFAVLYFLDQWYISNVKDNIILTANNFLTKVVENPKSLIILY